MDFGSVAELRAYALGIMSECASASAEEMLEQMKKSIEDRIYGTYSPNMYVRTMDLLNTPIIISADSNGMETEFADNGGWYSLVGATKGQHFFALEGLEGGSSWGRGETDMYPHAVVRCYSEVPKYYRECMLAHGVPLI